MTAWPAAMFLSAAAGSGLLTYLWIRFARSRRIEDHPSQRRLHTVPTPRGGGMAIAVVLIAAILVVASNSSSPRQLMGMGGGIALFASLGLLDDLASMPTLAKFVLQLVAATGLVLGVTQGWIPVWLVVVFLVIGCCYVVNIWNFMDGSNGLVTVQALLIALAMAFWPGQAWDLRLVALVLAGACLGFLPFNLPSARVFLGDVGSHTLGAAVFGLLLLAWYNRSIDAFQALLMGTVVLLDSGYTLLRRLIAGRPVWRAHRDHLYQYAVRRGHSHARVCLYYGLYTSLAIVLALLANDHRSSFIPGSLLIFSWLLGTLLYFGLRKRWLDPGTHRGREA